MKVICPDMREGEKGRGGCAFEWRRQSTTTRRVKVMPDVASGAAPR